MNNIDCIRLRELLKYDPETGLFTWKIQTNSRAPVGSIAGENSITHGYRTLGINGKLYRQHRLAWFYVHGTWPVKNIDHINGNRLDNRIANLRDVSQAVNAQNLQGAKTNNASGFLGVDWRPKRNKWRAQIRIGGVKKEIGNFDTAEQAHQAYINARASIGGAA